MKTKNLHFVLVLLFGIFFTSLHGQKYRFNITLGVEQEMLNGLSAQYIASTADLDMTGVNMNQFDKSTLYSMYCENPYVRAGLTWELPKQRANVYTGITGIFNRWDDIYYRLADPNADYQYMNFSSVSHELGVETALEKRYTLLNFLYFDAALGANLGYSFGGYAHASYMSQTAINDVNARSLSEIVGGNDIAMEEVVSPEDTHVHGSLNNGLHARLYGKLGAGIIVLNTFEIGAQVRLGMGIRKIFGADAVRTNLAGGDLTVGYRF